MSSTTPDMATPPPRIASIDVLRGVALLGLPLMNLQLFAMPHAALNNPTAFGDLTGANWAVRLLSRLLGGPRRIARRRRSHSTPASGDACSAHAPWQYDSESNREVV